jgi:hypothetical protein
MLRDEAKFQDPQTQQHLKPIIQAITQMSIGEAPGQMPSVRSFHLASVLLIVHLLSSKNYAFECLRAVDENVCLASAANLVWRADVSFAASNKGVHVM